METQWTPIEWRLRKRFRVESESRAGGDSLRSFILWSISTSLHQATTGHCPQRLLLECTFKCLPLREPGSATMTEGRPCPESVLADNSRTVV
jgi:hypothetical protein